MKVCKFGGSSLADAGQLNKVIDIVLADPARRIVVVSAPGKRDGGDTKVTDLLISLAQTALKGENTDREFGAVVERYASIAGELKLGEEIVRQIELDLMDRLAKVSALTADEFMDLMKAAGEDNNAKLVAVAFSARGRKARYASPKDTGMVLKGDFGNAELDPESYATLSRAFSNFDGIVIYPGFFGYTRDGKVATFPRGGSDITGSILAAAVCADVYENFTDVDSVYPCDPRIVPEVKNGEGIPTMTYREMRELAYAGFGVFNDDAVIPAVRARIPINIRNTNHPGEPGTMIQQSRRVVQTIKRELQPDFVTVERDFTMLMIVGEGMCYTPGMLAKACLALASAGISMSMVNQGSSEVSFMIAIRSKDRDSAVQALYKAFFS